MSITIKNTKKIIVDTTLISILKEHGHINDDFSEEFLMLLGEIGVDFIELDCSVLEKINTFPQSLDYIYRVDDFSSDLGTYNQFEYVVADYEKVKKSKILDSFKHIKIILEVDVRVIDEIFTRETSEIFKDINIKVVRIKNAVKYNLYKWSKIIKDIKTNFNADVDFCADDKFHMATAVSMEACADGADSITAAFNGQKFGRASLEEVIIGLKVIKGAEIQGNLKLLEKLTKVYSKLTGCDISPMKAVIGRDIFKCESGIHVDGIYKNPNTYEPYNPCDIGSIRSVYIGKHSGKRAVMLKLDELEIDYSGVDMEQFLKKVREFSINLKRNIHDRELAEIFRCFRNTCLR